MPILVSPAPLYIYRNPHTHIQNRIFIVFFFFLKWGTRALQFYTGHRFKKCNVNQMIQLTLDSLDVMRFRHVCLLIAWTRPESLVQRCAVNDVIIHLQIAQLKLGANRPRIIQLTRSIIQHKCQTAWPKSPGECYMITEWFFLYKSFFVNYNLSLSLVGLWTIRLLVLVHRHWVQFTLVRRVYDNHNYHNKPQIGNVAEVWMTSCPEVKCWEFGLFEKHVSWVFTVVQSSW